MIIAHIAIPSKRDSSIDIRLYSKTRYAYLFIITYLPLERNKIFILLRSSAPHKNSCQSSAAEPFAGFAAPPQLPPQLTQAVCPAQSQQNYGFVSFGFLTPYSFPQICLDQHITSRPRCQLIFRPAAARRRRNLASSCWSAMA